MESNYSDRDFEDYIKENADQYRMFPSEKVWQGVNNALHTRRRWYGFWLGFLLLITGGAVTWVMTTHSVTAKNDKAGSGLANPNIFTVNTDKNEKPVIKNIAELLPFASKEVISSPNYNVEKGLIALPAIAGEEIETDFSQETLAIDRETDDKHPLKNLEQADFSITTHPVSLFEAVQLPTTVNHVADENNTQAAAVNTTPKQIDNPSPYTIESVINAYKHKKPIKKISWQLFVTPTISYRRLSVNKSVDNPSASNYPFASLRDVNSAVTHKPDLGLQIGLSGRYPITKGLKIRGGLQFNINRYDIKAYAFNGEVAKIDLNSSSGSNSTISTWTYYRNYSGYRSDWLKNFYFSVSAPIGVELKLAGNNKTNIGVAGTIQPTYILNDNAYLISTDYKNYAEVPKLIRHVNLNTGFETFVNYTSGKTKWQVGPQVRYQILSSFHDKYPIRENLFDFGLKVGVTLNK